MDAPRIMFCQISRLPITQSSQEDTKDSLAQQVFYIPGAEVRGNLEDECLPGMHKQGHVCSLCVTSRAYNILYLGASTVA